MLCSLSDRESRYFEEIFNPKKSVWGRISTFLMSGYKELSWTFMNPKSDPQIDPLWTTDSTKYQSLWNISEYWTRN